ncbi:MAG: DNA-deoxyinosine glycosylase [Clostridia bacterium]|jgi:double-stranded uracil-DNA glycosylase|nr:DNA-deoxyinosine glycosylase [Clostridia bacterium]
MPKHCFAPLIDERCTALILGSMPGEESLRKQEYYGHPRNAFWRLLNSDLAEKSYVQKREYLLSHCIALWDVLGSAERKGSLDSAIRNEVPNDFDKFLRQHPNIRHIFFNGGKAKSAFAKYFTDLYIQYDCVQLPSSSPAYTLAFEEKKLVWRNALSLYV